MSDRTMSKRLAWLPLLTLLAMLGPVLAGVLGTLAPAFGYLPAVGQTDWTLDPFRKLSDWPGVFSASRLSLTTGLAATAVSLGIVVLITAGWTGTRAFARIERLLSPLLSVPHAAAAFGIAFLIAPSGWIARAFSPWFTGWDRPPDLLIVQDTWGLTLTAGLIAKEVPFLMLMTLATLGQAQNSQSRMVAQSLGYGRVSGWIKTVFPRVYAQIRLPVYVVLAYSMSVVDVAVILGPNTPPTLSVQIVRWMSDPDLMMRLQAAAAALLQLALVVAALVLWRTLEILVSGIGLFLIRRGNRGVLETVLRSTGMVAALVTSLSIILGLASLLIWSFAGLWSFPDAIPDSLTMRSWMRHGDSIIGSFGQTMAIAGIATLIALVLTIGSLEAEHRYGISLNARSTFLLYLPLMIPQTAFLPGLQTLMLGVGAKVGIVPVIAAHVVFVLPYVFLSLGAPFRAWDTRYASIAGALGSSADRVLWRVRLPMLLRSVLIATAIGFAVSVGQYLPTLLIGGGRVQTLTTEAVALASGGDRRAIGVYGLGQTLAALLPFAIATLLPAMIWQNRRGLRHE